MADKWKRLDKNLLVSPPKVRAPIPTWQDYEDPPVNPDGGDDIDRIEMPTFDLNNPPPRLRRARPKLNPALFDAPEDLIIDTRSPALLAAIRKLMMA
jgi:hypothetical protein